MTSDARLTAARSAGKRALIRRATFDLTGLPPTPEQITEAQRLTQEWIDTHSQAEGEALETIRTIR